LEKFQFNKVLKSSFFRRRGTSVFVKFQFLTGVGLVSCRVRRLFDFQEISSQTALELFLQLDDVWLAILPEK